MEGKFNGTVPNRNTICTKILRGMKSFNQVLALEDGWSQAFNRALHGGCHHGFHA
jgi:hypothetical protein